MKLLLFCLALALTPILDNKNINQNGKMEETETQKLDISFVSNGLLIKGWLFLPLDSAGRKLPAIVMAPGFSGTKECNYQFFASNFAREGYAALLFDNPNFGESAGLVKGEVDPWQQIQAYRDGITYLGTRDEIDKNRIGVWGGSYSGGHAIVVSAIDNRVKCMVAMTPFISGSYYMKNLQPEAKSFLFQQFDADRLSRLKGGAPVRIPVATNDRKQFAAISSPNAWSFIQSFKDYAPAYENAVTLKSLEMQLEYEPGYYVQNIGNIPKLFIVARQDELIPEQLVLDAYGKATEPKKLSYIDGHHFSPYMESLQAASNEAIAWFKLNL